MSQSSMRRSAIRILLLAGLLEAFVLACDATSPIDPATNASTLWVPDHVMDALVPSGLSAAAVSWERIDISWARIANASGYQIFRSTTGPTGTYALIASTSATVTSYVDTGLTGSTQYCYEIRSIKTAGRNTSYSAFSAATCVTTLAPPVVAPSETDAVPLGNVIQIKWKDNSSDESGFHLEQASSAIGPWVQAANASANATSANLSATPEQQVCFRVIAFNSIGPSLPSPVDCTALPATPTYLSARAYVQGITISWIDNSVVEDGYRVSRLEAGGVWTDIATLPANSGTYGSYQDVAVTANVRYTYRVQALKDGGYSEVSNEAGAIIPTTLPAAPTGASAAFDGGPDPYWHLYLIVVWSDNSSNEDGFQIDWSPDGQTGWSAYAVTAANTSSFFQDIGTGGWPQDGCFRVTAFNALGSSEPSNVSCSQAPAGLPGGG